MAKPDYSNRTFNLATARDRETIIGHGAKINAVVVLAIPAGAVATLHFGAGADPVVCVAGDSWQVSGIENGCPVPLDEGLFLSNPAGAGNLDLMISFGAFGVTRVA